MEKMNSSLKVQKFFTIAHNSDVSAVRRYGTQLGASLGFSETQSGRLAITVTELATNILKHAKEGVMFLTPAQQGAAHSIQVLALDKGPGIASLAQSMCDGMSTTGTAGNGLGAIKRLAHEFDAYSSVGKGSAFYACVHAKGQEENREPVSPDHADRPAIQYGAICVPIAGEEECGDAWAITTDQECVTILVADGLGHGPDAAAASGAAVHTLKSKGNLTPTALINAMHQSLRTTRGAALAIGQFRYSTGNLNFSGIGNIGACIVEAEARKQLVSHNGTVGHIMRKVQEFTAPWPREALYIMCSDGITTQWDLNPYPGLMSCHPAIIAGIIYRDFSRVRDDATVVVVKQIRYC